MIMIRQSPCGVGVNDGMVLHEEMLLVLWVVVAHDSITIIIMIVGSLVVVPVVGRRRAQ
jgi:hypothetical protein